MALAIPVWAVVVAVVVGLIFVLVVLITTRQFVKIRARKRLEEMKAGEEFPPMRRLTVRRGKVVPIAKRRWSGVGSSIFGDRRRPGSRFSSVTDLEKAESHRSRSPFGIWPTSSYQAQEDEPSNELETSKGKKRTSTREGNMEYLRDVDRQFLRQLPTVSESGRKSRRSERSYSIPSIINARQFAEEGQSKRPLTSSTEVIEEMEEPDSTGVSPAANQSVFIHANQSEESLPSPTLPVFRRLGLSSDLSLPKSEFSPARMLQRSQSPAIPSPLSIAQSVHPSPLSMAHSPFPTPTYPENASTSLPTTPRSQYSPMTPRDKYKSSLMSQQNYSNSTPSLPTTKPTTTTPSASSVLRNNSGISRKSPSPYGTVSTTITATNPMPPPKSRSRSKSTSPTRKSRSRSRSRTKSSLEVSRSQSRSKSRGRSPHPSSMPDEPKVATLLPTMNPTPGSGSRSPYYTPPTHPATSSLSLETAGRSITNLATHSFSDISSTFTTGQAQPQPMTMLSPTAVIGLSPFHPRSPTEDKQLPRLPTTMLPSILPPDRPGDDVVMGVARSQSKKGRVLRKQSRNSLKGKRAQAKEKAEEED